MAFIYVFSAIFYPLVTRQLHAALHPDSLDHHHQIRPTNPGLVSLNSRGRKRALFQTLIPKHISAGLPVQKFDMCAATIDKDKYFARCRIAAQLTAYQTAQPVKTFTHIAGATIQVIGIRIAQREHNYQARIKLLITDRFTPPIRRRTPLG